MLTMILAELIVAASASLAITAGDEGQAEAPKARRVCRNVPSAYSRTPRRICTTKPEPASTAVPLAKVAPVPVATTPGIGMMVVDAQGGPVGTITGLAADTVTVKTAKYQAQLPRTSLTISEGKALIGMTQAELDASVEKTLLTMSAGLKAGAAVKARGGENVGTIEAIDAQTVTIALSGGQRINIPRWGIVAHPEGGGIIGLTAAELEAQVKTSQPAG